MEKALYSDLIGGVVRIYLNNNTFVGVLKSTDHTSTILQPSLVSIGTLLEDRAIISDDQKIIATHNIYTVEPIPEGLKYMKKIVKDLEELTRRKSFIAEKELKEKGYELLLKTT